MTWFILALTQSSVESGDALINPALALPPRPTISNMQWIGGTQHITPSDMDLLSMSLGQDNEV